MKDRQSGLGNEEKFLMLHKEYQKLDKKLEDIARTVEQNQLEDCFIFYYLYGTFIRLVCGEVGVENNPKRVPTVQIRLSSFIELMKLLIVWRLSTKNENEQLMILKIRFDS